jgi:hypothetical protein
VNREQAIRLGFGQAIKGQITYDTLDIKSYDEVTTNEVPDEKMYILFTQQTATNASNYTRFSWNCIQTIEIVSKQRSSVSKNIVDVIGEQIEQIIIYPENQPGEGYMTPQAGWEFRDILLESVTYTEFVLDNNYYEITKILQVSCIATKIS